jgi:uncharacterized protein (DUF58 family)
MPATPIFDPAFLRKLEALRLWTRQPLHGVAAGSRRAPGLGASVEFADFRSYTPGDDLRRVDWNAYARLERLFLRLYRAEENLTLTLILDTSASMAWGTPPKDRFAQQTAAALAYLALTGEDRVALARCGSAGLSYLPPVGGRSAISRVWDALAAAPSEGAADLNGALREFGRYRPGPGVAVVLSDLLLPGGYQDGLKTLLHLRQEVVVLQVLAPDELAPELAGDLRLIDAEDGRAVEVSLTPRVLRAYRERLTAYTRAVAAFCAQHGITFLQLRSDLNLEDVVLRLLRRAAVVN